MGNEAGNYFGDCRDCGRGHRDGFPEEEMTPEESLCNSCGKDCKQPLGITVLLCPEYSESGKKGEKVPQR